MWSGHNTIVGTAFALFGPNGCSSNVLGRLAGIVCPALLALGPICQDGYGCADAVSLIRGCLIDSILFCPVPVGLLLRFFSHLLARFHDDDNDDHEECYCILSDWSARIGTRTRGAGHVSRSITAMQGRRSAGCLLRAAGCFLGLLRAQVLLPGLWSALCPLSIGHRLIRRSPVGRRLGPGYTRCPP